MDESIKGKMELKGSDEGSRWITVTGYDTSLPADDVKSALRERFSSCGEIIQIIVKAYVVSGVRNEYAFICFKGEAAKKKAVELITSDMGGLSLVAEDPPTLSPHDIAPWNVHNQKRKRFTKICVMGYDHMLTQNDIGLALREHFGSCGQITDVNVISDRNSALITIVGEGALEKALALGGSNMGGYNLVVKVAHDPIPCEARGYAGPDWYVKKMAKNPSLAGWEELRLPPPLF